MKIGEKIKQARVLKKLTQADVAGEGITRNMLSFIESGKASPSLETVEYLAKRLELPAAYLLSEENDLFFYKKKERMPAIKNALEAGNYNIVVSLILGIDGSDDELNYILSMAYFNLGISSAKLGSLSSAKSHLEHCLSYCEKTLYDTKRFEAIIPIYMAIANNVTSPLLEFEEEKFNQKMLSAFDYEFYKYVTLDMDYEYTFEQFALHRDAKILIKERKYSEAIKILSQIEETKSKYEANAYVMFVVYTDLESCYKQNFDFENAYRYASKRISLLEGFKS